MKVKIRGEEKSLQPLKGRVVKKIRSMMFSVMQYDDEKEQAKAAEELLEFVDKESALIAGLSVDELDDLDVEEKQLIVGYVVGKVNESMDFLKSSSTPRS